MNHEVFSITQCIKTYIQNAVYHLQNGDYKRAKSFMELAIFEAEYIKSDTCKCGSDDVILDWHIVNDQNGALCPVPMWAVECQKCERITPYFETAKEAAEHWKQHGGELVMQ